MDILTHCRIEFYRCLSSVYFLFVTLYTKFTYRRPKITSCLIGKVALVTGGNSGIGYNVCLNLASRGCTVIMADVNHSEESRQEIIKLTGNPNVIIKHVDLASFKSVREFAKDLNGNLDKLDIFLSNAGIAGSPTCTTEDGLHPVMQVNYFSHFLLTHLLIDKLKRSGAGRVLYTSSAAAYTENLEIQKVNSNQAGIAYANSKLALIIAAKYFTEKIKGVTFNAIHPGILPTTNIFDTVTRKSHGWYHKLLSSLVAGVSNSLFISTTCWATAEQMVYLVTSKDMECISGKFFFEDRIYEMPGKAQDPEFSEKLITLSEDIVKLSTHENM